jgi:polyhydroxybutyrate depolymerase
VFEKRPMKARFLLFFLLGVASISMQSQTNGSFDFEGVSRNYIVYVPSGHNMQNPASLVIVLHGFTQTAQAIMNYSNFNAYAEENSFIVAYPNGIGNSWNVGVGGGSTANDVGFLSALIDTLNAQYGVDQERVYATGFSNGGFMSYRLACELNHRIAAIASVAGTMSNATYDACEPGRTFPIMHIHGTSDFIVSYNGGFGNKSVNEVIDFWVSNNNCPENPEIIQLPDLVQEGSTVEQHTYTPCDDETEVVLLRVVNGGHTWPGATGNSGIGNTNRDISASEEIWSFVSRFSNPLITNTFVINKKNLKVYPNPVQSGQVSIAMPYPGQAALVEIFTPDGKQLFQKEHKVVPPQLHFDSGGWPVGILFVTVRQQNISFRSKILNQQYRPNRF